MLSFFSFESFCWSLHLIRKSVEKFLQRDFFPSYRTSPSFSYTSFQTRSFPVQHPHGYPRSSQPPWYPTSPRGRAHLQSCPLCLRFQHSPSWWRGQIITLAQLSLPVSWLPRSTLLTLSGPRASSKETTLLPVSWPLRKVIMTKYAFVTSLHLPSLAHHPPQIAHVTLIISSGSPTKPHSHVAKTSLVPVYLALTWAIRQWVVMGKAHPPTQEALSTFAPSHKKLTTMYPTIANSIVQKFNNEIHSTSEEDTGHCFFVDPPGNNKMSTLCVSLLAIFPIPRRSNFCLNSPVEIKALTTDTNAALFKDTLMSKGTDDTDFIVDDPIFCLWTITAAGPHSYHLTAKSILEADFLSLPFKEHQSAALACGWLCIADRLFFTHREEKLKDIFNVNHQAAYTSKPDEEDFMVFSENFPTISGKTPSITSISLLSSLRQGNIQASINANHPFGSQKGHPPTSAASISNMPETSFFKKALSQVNRNGIPVSWNGLPSKVTLLL